MASTSAIWPVQVAIYATLKADAIYMALSTGGVHNDVPDGQPYPHTLISRPTETTFNTFGGPTAGIGRNVLARVHFYSRYQGDMEATDMLERAVALLDFQEIPVAGFSSAMWEYEGGRVLVEAIDKIETRHLVGEFRVMVQQ